jgi:hypothetical protein
MKSVLFALLTLLALLKLPMGQDTAAPGFQMWIECVERGPYAGQAVADLSYQYDGTSAVTPEVFRAYGDTPTGQGYDLPLTIEPGQHERVLRFPVGAFQAVLLKLVLFNQLHVLAVYDDPQIPDCPSLTPVVTPEPTGANA